MSSRKEEERNEKIIRGLMKLPPNRRCINCNSLGPQYVCTNFWTFVCMTCSGIHREFTHRVKSVSMSKFTTQEVEALQEGGNQRARETFLKDWDPREQRLPDNSNVEKVRMFIKSVYVDKKFFASKASGKPPRDILNHRIHEDETRRASSYHSYSQSPPYDYQYEERRYGKQAPALTKKPGSDRGMLRFLSTSRLSDHGQEDMFANEVSNTRVSDYSASSGGDPFRPDTQSPTRQRGFGFSSPSSETSRDILSEDIQKYSVNTSSNLEAKGDPDQVTHAQRTDSFKSLDSISKEFITPNSGPPSLPNSSESGKFDGLDLFSTPYAPQTIKSAPSSSVDLFQLSNTSSALAANNLEPPHNSVAPTLSANQQSDTFGPSSLDLFSVMGPVNHKSPDVVQKNEGWATFDMPWHVEPSQGTKSAIPVSETSASNESSGKFDHALSMDTTCQWSFDQKFSANGPSSSMQDHWHGGVRDIGAPLSATNNQSWSPFEESITPFQSVYTHSGEQISVQDPSVSDPYPAWGILENLQNFKIQQPAVGSLDSLSELTVLDGAQSRELDAKSRNPFDLPIENDLESTNMFLDMSSLQSSLPDNNISTPWFPESAAISQDSLLFMAGQAPSRQIPNIQAQGHVASIGGNPFG